MSKKKWFVVWRANLPMLVGGEGHISSSTLVLRPELSTKIPISKHKTHENHVDKELN